MKVSIYFTETRDFKLVREQIITETNEYLVYVYADTKNIKIPRDLIRDLPVLGNNIIWVDSAKMDSSQLVNHVVLTIGQFLNTEDPIRFFIANRTSKFEKALALLKSQDIPVEQIGLPLEKTIKKPSGRRGRPKGSKNRKIQKLGTSSEIGLDTPKRKRGRPRKVEIEEPALAPKKKRGRPAKVKSEEEVKPVAKKRGRPRKEIVPAQKTRKKREEKPISSEMIESRLQVFSSNEKNVVEMQRKIFALRKVQRPKYDEKLKALIQKDLKLEESEAISLVEKMKTTGMMDNSGKGGRLIYND